MTSVININYIVIQLKSLPRVTFSYSVPVANYNPPQHHQTTISVEQSSSLGSYSPIQQLHAPSSYSPSNPVRWTQNNVNIQSPPPYQMSNRNMN